MNAFVILEFAFATILPVCTAAGFYYLQRNTRFGRLGFWQQQVIIGVVFGIIAITGTEFGIQTNDATMNVRDASPLIAGLLFGSPSGIIAGALGGIERWFAALWGRGMFTRVGCSVATVAAGVYAALLHKYMFDNKKPGILISFAIGVVVEVLHFTLVFFTNMDDVAHAYMVIRACAIPMIFCNALAVALSVLVIKLMSHEPLFQEPEHREITQVVQSSMFVATLVAFAVTTAFMFGLQSSLATSQNKNLFSLNIQDVQDDVEDALGETLLQATQNVATRIGSVDRAKRLAMNAIAKSFDVSEVNVVDDKGIIVRSSNPEFVGFDMSSGEQSAEFLQLLDGTTTSLVQKYQPISYDPTGLRKYAAVTVPGGFVQVGYDASDFQKVVAEKIANITRNRHVGEQGCVLIVDAEGTIVSAPNDFAGQTLESLGLEGAINQSEPDKLFGATFNGESVVGMYSENEGYRIVAIQPVSEAHFTRNVSVLVSAFMEVIVFAALFTVIYILIKRVVVDNIRKINRTLAQITAGNLDASVNVRSNEEFASLSDDINETVAALKLAIAEAAARLDAELEYARTIQRSALPSVFPPFPTHDDFQIFASMDAAKEVGGDFYDFYLLDDDHLAFLIADVSGKGIPASLFMMRAKTLLKSLAESGLPVDEVFTRANDQLCENNEAEMFVTCWMGMLDLATGLVTFANAGHNPPALKHEGGSFELKPTRPNLVLAGMDGIPYRKHELMLEPGDTLFLYTDGVTEATDARNELFGDDRLIESLNAHAEESVEEICIGVHADVDAFVGEAPQFDDITVLALQFVGRS